MTHHHHPDEAREPGEFWESWYQERDQVWSGKVNAVLAEVASSLEPGSALDLGCGEGGDVVWLAQQGWDAIGIDISPAAIERARLAAEEQGVEDQASFLVGDLTELDLDGHFDLVTASFLQSPVALERAAILRTAASLVAPGGRLLLTSHAAPPPWAADEHRHDFKQSSPEAEVADLDLAPGEWAVETAQVRGREVTAPDGAPAVLEDSIVLVRRLP
ncbi:hypothetical protein BW730_05860 [Tessaracoccus aquimaris]|uniref:Methyltransferase domain-containing protein n=1 Tax=Tessaracoccus aquimaris TaxID=1332264 RepID=A0A1Q2CLY3_9ACTN|nr:class I SAM-dependent methyltransferase [Tessaracoccus aquimaris]AQP47111.1 hypothetical protein BW730_05860 [Tessaracoccus aquimaris]